MIQTTALALLWPPTSTPAQTGRADEPIGAERLHVDHVVTRVLGQSSALVGDGEHDPAAAPLDLHPVGGDRQKLLDAAVLIAVLAEVGVSPEAEMGDQGRDEVCLRRALRGIAEQVGGVVRDPPSVPVREPPVRDERARGRGISEHTGAGIDVGVAERG